MPGSLIRIGPKRKIAFVCSGGAAKAGAFHLGVALALQEQGFRFYGGLAPKNGPGRTPGPMEISTYVGSSAGSIIATFLAAGFSLNNIFHSFQDKAEVLTDPADVTPRPLPRLTYPKMLKIRPGLAKDLLLQVAQLRKVVFGLMEGNWDEALPLNWLKTPGIFSTAGIEKYLREEVLPSNLFADYLADLFIVATQLNHSRKVVFGKYSYKPPSNDLSCQYDSTPLVSEACAGSAALPPVYAPYAIRNSKGRLIYYIDGEIRDTLSTHVAEDAGADLIIASYTHQPYHFVREVGSLTDYGLPSIVVQSIFLLVEQKINTSIHHYESQSNAIRAVHQYCKDHGISEEHRRRICEIMEKELHHRSDVDRIYIHPKASDSKIFFGDNFSLNPMKMADYVRSGFHAAIEVLSRYEFADRLKGPATGSTLSDQAGG